jgi:polyisoprenoid-binding protein YceI
MLSAMKPVFLAAAAAAVVVISGCGSTTTTTPTAAPPASSANAAAGSATVAPATPPTTTAAAPTTPSGATTVSAPTAVARPTQVPPTTAPAGAQPTVAAGSIATHDAVKLVLDPSSSEAKYHARETLVGRTLPSAAVGTSKGVSGTIVLGIDGSVRADQSEIKVDLTRLQSDESRRDNWIKNDTIQTRRFPNATFVPRETQGLAAPLPTSGEATFQLVGDLTVHGVTKPATWQVTAQFLDNSVKGNATTNVKITDFAMTPPRVGPVLSIEDALTLELAFTAAREG